jgi:hypothetical protein
MSDLRSAAEKALKALEELNGWQSLAPPLASQAGRQAAINLRAALEQPEQPEQPYAEQARRVEQETHGRMRIDPVTGDLSIGTPTEQPEQEPAWRLSCGCPSQYGGIPAEWPETTREGGPAVAYGVVCEKHWHEYEARCPNCASLEAQNTELDRKLADLEEALKEMLSVWEEDPAYGAKHADKARAAIKKAEQQV